MYPHNLQWQVHPTYRHRFQTHPRGVRHVRREHHRAKPPESWSSPLQAAQDLHFACRFSPVFYRLAEQEAQQDVCPGPGPRRSLGIAMSQGFAHYVHQQSVHTQKFVKILYKFC